MAKRYQRRRSTRTVEKNFGRNLGHYIYRSPGGGTIFQRSTWEVKYSQYLDQKGLKWYYECMAFKTESGFYFPDFYVEVSPGVWEFHEVKGRLTEEANQKMISFQKMYPNEKLVILRAADLKALGLDI